MTDEQFGILIRAVMAYRFRGEVYSGDDIAIDIAFQFISNQVDRSESAKAAKAKAANSRWEKQSDADGCKAMQSNADGCGEVQSDAPIQSYPFQSIPIHSDKESKADKPPAPTEKSRKSYGEFGWVKLTDDEYNRLLNDLGEAEVKRCIEYLDVSAQSTGNKNKWRDWNLVIRKCNKQGWGLYQQRFGKKTDIPKGSSGELGSAELEAIQRVLRDD